MIPHHPKFESKTWIESYKDYLSGGLFALLILDLGMFVVHLMLERTASGYSLFSLVFIVAALALFHIEKLYTEQDESH